MGLLPIGEGSHGTFGVRPAAVPVSGPAPRFKETGAAPLARAMGYLGIGGALLGFIAVVLPHPSQFYVPGLLVLQAITVVIALPFIFFAERVPLWLVRVTPAVGTVINTIVIVFSGDATSSYAVFYLWVGLFAFYFLSRRDAVLHISFVAANYAVAIAVTGTANPSPGDSTSGDLIHHFLLTAGTLLIVGGLLLYMRGKIEDLMGRLTDAARTDLLTGLRNSRGIHEVLDAEVERAMLGGRHVSVLVVDLDRFKDVNERLGHQAGDRLLKRIGELFDEATRRIDAVARTGGEEFTLVLPEADQHTAYLVAEQLLSRIRRVFGGALTTSIGVAAYPDHARGLEELIKAADEALYAAKALGRDRAVLFSPEVAEVLTSVEGTRPADIKGHLATVLSLAEALDLRERGTASHSQSVGRYAEMIARELGMPDDKVERVRLAGVLHDVGKIAIPDSVLLKPGPLDEEDWAQMHQHPELGARILGSSELGDIREWVLASHERLDGRGYPRGLKGDEIPVEARILAVADAYEAMTADRIYRPAIGEDAARIELQQCTGTQFDPEVVAALLKALDRQDSQLLRGARSK